MSYDENRMQDVIEGGLLKQEEIQKAKKLAILDTETGGFSKTKNGVCEIALLIVTEDLEVVAEESFLIKPYTRLDDDGNETDELVSYKDDAIAIHGITVEELQEHGLSVEIAAERVLQILKANNVRTIVGHNLKAFDIPRVEYLTMRFLNKDLKKYGKECTLEHARSILKAPSYKLEDLCAQFGIKQENAHRALSDCYSTLGLIKLMQKKGLVINKTNTDTGTN